MTAFAELASLSQAIAATRSRIKKAELLAELLASLMPEERRTAVAWLIGETRQGKIGVGYKQLQGLSAGASQPGPSIAEVDATLDAIAGASGKGSAAKRKALLEALYARFTDAEAQLLGGVLTGELRQGGLDGVMVEALARVIDAPATGVHRARMLAGDLPVVAQTLLAEGKKGLERFSLQIFTPVFPMLASPTGGLEEAVQVLGTAAFEYKLDGARVQVHRDGDRVAVYTRALHDITARMPELVAAARTLPAQRFILDGEALSLDADGRPRPFQETMSSFSAEHHSALSVFFFDLLLRDDHLLIDAPASERAAALQTLIPESMRVPRLVTSDAQEAAAFFDKAIAAGQEGLVAKALDAPYQVGARGQAWLKIKPAHTLDLVVLAVERGSGRREGFLSNIHLGARDGNGGFVMLGKTFKGMTDAMLVWQTERFKELAVRDDGYTVWLRPEQVVEVAFDGVQASTTYPGGVALRFARVKRYRSDKSAAEADTLDQVVQLR